VVSAGGVYAYRVPVGFRVSLVVRGVTVDPAEMLATVTAAVDGNGIEIRRVGNVVRFTADELRDLLVLAVAADRLVATAWPDDRR
jgi:hypothetical protein